VGVPYRNAFYIARKIRNGMYVNQILERLKGTVEMDELYITAGVKGKKGRAGTGGGLPSRRGAGAPINHRDKPPVIGMASRETKQVGASPSSGVTGRDIINRAVKNIDSGATIYHDDYRSYGILLSTTARESTPAEIFTRTPSRESSPSSGPGCRPSGGCRRSTPTFAARTISS
jgi:hypothetical protein